MSKRKERRKHSPASSHLALIIAASSFKLVLIGAKRGLLYTDGMERHLVTSLGAFRDKCRHGTVIRATRWFTRFYGHKTRACPHTDFADSAVWWRLVRGSFAHARGGFGCARSSCGGCCLPRRFCPVSLASLSGCYGMFRALTNWCR